MEAEVGRVLPKAVLHDHLDGGLRVDTMIELAAQTGYAQLPSLDPDELDRAMHQGQSGSLVEYLKAFEHTVGVMQSAAAIERVAYECGIDHHNDGVAYAEVRFGPSLLTRHGLTQGEAIEAALAGLSRAAGETGLVWGLIVTALRDSDDSDETARTAARYVGDGVVGFDLAGPEIGYPPDEHLPAIRYAREHGLGITLHAGEAAGLDSIGAAVAKCGAQRLGHGVRIIEDCKVANGEIVDVGLLAARIRDHRIPLECAVTSNIHTALASDAASHPFGLLYRAGFNVTINTDNRLMSAVTMSSELALVAETFQLGLDDIETITIRTIEAGFGDWQQRRQLRESVVAAYASNRG